MKTYQYLLFDLDGTLTDPGEGITNSVAYALEKFGICVADKTTLHPFIGPPLVESFIQFYGFSREDAARAVESYREYFRDRGIFENVPYAGITEVLEKLQAAGKTLIVATSKPEPFARRIMEHFCSFVNDVRLKRVKIKVTSLDKCVCRRKEGRSPERRLQKRRAVRHMYFQVQLAFGWEISNREQP